MLGLKLLGFSGLLGVILSLGLGPLGLVDLDVVAVVVIENSLDLVRLSEVHSVSMSGESVSLELTRPSATVLLSDSDMVDSPDVRRDIAVVTKGLGTNRLEVQARQVARGLGVVLQGEELLTGHGLDGFLNRLDLLLLRRSHSGSHRVHHALHDRLHHNIHHLLSHLSHHFVHVHSKTFLPINLFSSNDLGLVADVGTTIPRQNFKINCPKFFELGKIQIFLRWIKHYI
nr:MAG TPA: hypothetical protein [Caudoviricetes sp.]